MKDFCHHLKKGADLLGLNLSPDQTGLLAAHARELQLWNAKMNLTAITDIRLVAYKHFLDALGCSQVSGPVCSDNGYRFRCGISCRSHESNLPGP